MLIEGGGVVLPALAWPLGAAAWLQAARARAQQQAPGLVRLPCSPRGARGRSSPRPQISLRLKLGLFHCRACLHSLNLPRSSARLRCGVLLLPHQPRLGPPRLRRLHNIVQEEEEEATNKLADPWSPWQPRAGWRLLVQHVIAMRSFPVAHVSRAWTRQSCCLRCCSQAAGRLRFFDCEAALDNYKNRNTLAFSSQPRQGHAYFGIIFGVMV